MWIIWIINITAHAMAILTFRVVHSKADSIILFPFKLKGSESAYHEHFATLRSLFFS